ncbi:zinc-dependent peptidase [Xanthomonadaceae bacterium JHOS43]|nr:zinc-dependent peptidase [Xanthomonadaceae bacterium JHOS43]
MKWLRRWLGGPPPTPLEDAIWTAQLARIDGAEALSSDRARHWREFTTRFLTDKAITPAGDCELSAGDRVLVAMLCCEPVLDLGYDWLRGWHEVIVYPGEFGVRRHHLDEDSGIVHEWDDALAGECWEQGPLILSLTDTVQAAESPLSGFQVVAHEIAHKLDLLDGSLDGVPPLRDKAWHVRWVHDFQSAFDTLRCNVEAGNETLIDPYASESPDEFFAVASEYHFTDPELLAEQMPAVAGHLMRFYHPGTLTA